MKPKVTYWNEKQPWNHGVWVYRGNVRIGDIQIKWYNLFK